MALYTVSAIAPSAPGLFDRWFSTTLATEFVYDPAGKWVQGNLWDDLRAPATAIKVPSTNYPTWAPYKGSQVLEFSDQAIIGNEEYVYIIMQLPHTYQQGTDVYPHVHWVPEDNTAGNVRWRLTHSWASIEAAFPGETPIYVNAAAPELTDEHAYGAFAAIDGTGKNISSMLLLSLSRNSSDDLDTYDGKFARLLEFDLHFQLNTMGSKVELTK